MRKLLHKLFITALLSAGSYAAQSQIVISTIAGDSLVSGYTGDGNYATAAYMAQPTDLAFDTVGNLYIADFLNQVVRKIDTAGIITTVAGTGFGAGTAAAGGFSGDGGPATDARLNGPYALAVDKHGNIFIADGYNHVVRKVNAAGIITTIAGSHLAGGYSGDGGPATAALLNNPVGLAVDDTGNLFIADNHNNVIRKINTAGIISTYAGDSTVGHAGNGGPATDALLSLPLGVAVDKKGNLYIADADNNVIRKVDTAHIITDYVGYDTVHGYSGDGGPASAAQLFHPIHLSVDDSDNLYIGDAYNNVVRKVNAAGIISTVAGNGTAGFGGDWGPPTAAMMFYPHSVVKDKTGALLIADRGNNVIRRVGPPIPLITAAPHTAAIADKVSIYPNPVHGERFTVTVVAATTEPVTISILSAVGQVIRTMVGFSNVPMNIMADVAPGTYFVAARTSSGVWTNAITIQ